MTVSVLFLAGRFLLAVPFVLIGVDRAVDGEATPAVRLWAVLGLLAAAAVVLGLWGDVAALVLGVTIVGAGLASHHEERGHTLLLLVGLLGAAVCVAALYAAVGTAIDFTITDPVLDLDLR
jgi:hypothetical protein